METKKELKILIGIIVVFLGIFFMPVESQVFNTAIDATLDLSKWYAREHVILCLLPAFLIAGVISVFVSQGSVIKYFGAKAKRWVAYTVAQYFLSFLAFIKEVPVWDLLLHFSIPVLPSIFLQ